METRIQQPSEIGRTFKIICFIYGVRLMEPVSIVSAWLVSADSSSGTCGVRKYSSAWAMNTINSRSPRV